MGNVQCCSRRNKDTKYNNFKNNVDLQTKIIKHMTNKKLEYNISKLKNEKNENICFTIVYSVGVTGAIIILCFSFEPTVAITTFLMSSTLSYYIKKIIDNNNSNKLYTSELERRKFAFINLIDKGKIYVHNQ